MNNEMHTVVNVDVAVVLGELGTVDKECEKGRRENEKYVQGGLPALSTRRKQ